MGCLTGAETQKTDEETGGGGGEKKQGMMQLKFFDIVNST